MFSCLITGVPLVNECMSIAPSENAWLHNLKCGVVPRFTDIFIIYASVSNKILTFLETKEL